VSTIHRTTPYSQENPKTQRLNDMLVAMFCTEGLPFRLLDSAAFKAFMNELDPRYKLPTRQALSKCMIPERYVSVRSGLMASTSQSKVQAIATDMWTSSNNCSYVGVTAHWTDGSFAVQNKCLAVKPAPGSHTADYIPSELDDVLSEWTTDKADLRVVTDSGANVKKAIGQMPMLKWCLCFEHTL